MPPKLSWSDVRFQVLSPSDLAPWARSLRELERAITYPIDDGRDHFYIDHGADYHSFYSQMGAPCYFLVATVRDQPVGLMAGVVKRVVGPSGDERRALYAGDLKVAAPYRGTGLVAAMMRWVLLALARDRDLRRWDFAFGAAMRGARGDVTRTTSGAHPLKLMRAISRQSLWFVTPQQLISLRGEGPTRRPVQGSC